MTDETVFDAETLEAARVFFAHPVSFMMGAVAMDGLPAADLPEVAFAGRSNVGKSSLINALLRRSKAARVSRSARRSATAARRSSSDTARRPQRKRCRSSWRPTDLSSPAP